jgi:hypothetical protein
MFRRPASRSFRTEKTPIRRVDLGQPTVVASTLSLQVTCLSGAEPGTYVVRCSHCGIVRAYAVRDQAEAIAILIHHKSAHGIAQVPELTEVSSWPS